MIADIIELIAIEHLHIMCWQVRLGQLRRQPGIAGSGRGLAAAWDTLADLIDLHMAADDEVCAPAIYGTGPYGLALIRETRDAHECIREIIDETRPHSPGQALWWNLATAALAAWTQHMHWEVHGPPTDCRRRADPELRARLALQWRAFMDAQIRDRHPQPLDHIPTCQLRQFWPAAGVPRLVDPAFAALACTCVSCTRELDLTVVRPLASAAD